MKYVSSNIAITGPGFSSTAVRTAFELKHGPVREMFQINVGISEPQDSAKLKFCLNPAVDTPSGTGSFSS